jgi:putative ABC transport system substrate-binding protein
MRHRDLLSLVVAAGWSLAAQAQQPGVPQAGLLVSGDNALVRTLREGLREHGWIEGQNLILHVRWTEARQERAQAIAAEFALMQLAVIIAPATGQYEEARRATSTTPIVFCTHGDPVGTGHAISLARPGGNMTGLSLLHDALSAKKVEILLEAIPTVRRIAILFDPTVATAAINRKAVETVAVRLGIATSFIEMRTPDAIGRAFENAKTESVDAVFVLPSNFTYFHREELSRLALFYKVPSMFSYLEDTRAGGLVAYAPDLTDTYRRCAGYVDKILRGANPAELPIQQPTTFKLAINMRTAAELGVTIPPSLLARADEVIE